MLRKSFCLFAVLMVGAGFVPTRGHAQTYAESPIYSFCYESNNVCDDGATPEASLVQGADGNLYGTANYGGANYGTASPYGYGAIYRVSPSGSLTLLYSFCSQADCTDGTAPRANLVQGSDGNFYGTTSIGGANVECDGDACGTVFKITPSGVFTTLYSFCGQGGAECTDGGLPFTGLIQGTDGDFYGTTLIGGLNGDGTVFKITPTGTLTTVYNFCSQGGASCTDGDGPQYGLIQGADGNFYGTTAAGGSNLQASGYSSGTVFKLTPSGTLSTIYDFCGQTACSDGAWPTGLVQGANGNLYGTTQIGGVGQNGANDGTLFEITPAGSLTTLYTFCSQVNCNDGADPATSLFLASDGNFYGTTNAGGTNVACSGSGCGTIFKISQAGEFSSIYSFCSQTDCADGEAPNEGMGLSEGSTGALYGTTSTGGANDTGNTNYSSSGVVFSVNASPSLPQPIQLSVSQGTVALGDSVTLNWQVLNAFSDTMQQCYAFMQNDATGAGNNWTGLQTGKLANGIYSGSATITPTVAGFYTYALTCGGSESGFANMVAGGKATSYLNFNSNGPAILGNSVTLIAVPLTNENIAPITGKVTFAYGSIALGTASLNSNGVALLNVTADNIATGTYPITATYSGNVNYQSSSATGNVVVEGYATFATLSASSTSVTQDQSITLKSIVSRTAVSGTPTGTVTFYIGTVPLATVKLVDGVATFTADTNESIAPGTYAITAVYSGDSVDQGTSTPVVDVVVTAALSATKTSMELSANPVPADSTVTLTATVKEQSGSGVPMGSVSFSSGSYGLGSSELVNGTAAINASDAGIAPGTYPVSATYSGDFYNAPSSTTVNVTVQ